MTKGRQGSYKYLEQIKMKQVEEAGGDLVVVVNMVSDDDKEGGKQIKSDCCQWVEFR